MGQYLTVFDMYSARFLNLEPYRILRIRPEYDEFSNLRYQVGKNMLISILIAAKPEKVRAKLGII